MIKEDKKENIYIIEVLINKYEKYYLADYDFSLSKNKRDAVIFIKENNAYKLASIIETKYKEALGKVRAENIEDVIY
ncbi:hypothetical protein [Clostridium botulinum]|uniref:Uncharacterized protein n=1 Tax=Clostridium botulinum B2 450 TaxID=1379739 RepID=A0A0D1AG10_CLOBO|nr:hypothetical protein [Clostridium botulinum]KIS22059.1 hypothetical protein N495_16375 [Clostridium botulinum B2 450]